MKNNEITIFTLKGNQFEGDMMSNVTITFKLKMKDGRGFEAKTELIPKKFVVFLKNFRHIL